jgi:pre-mRNA-splicing factor SYF2
LNFDTSPSAARITALNSQTISIIRLETQNFQPFIPDANMAPRSKRKTAPIKSEEGSAKRRFIESGSKSRDTDEPSPAVVPSEEVPEPEEEPVANAEDAPEPTPLSAPAKDTAAERRERFKALQARQNKSKEQNLKESRLESQRLATDPNLLTALNRKHAIASHKLLKADTVAAGEDFERKRAWDWTVEESEKWDKRVEKKEKHRQDVAFQDYTQEARKTYKRQMRDFKPDLEAYERQKMQAIQDAAANGGLEIVETEEGELIAVDKDGSFYSTADSTEFARNKPDKEAIDRLVDDLRKAEENRLKKQRQRVKQAQGDDGGDITYINVKVCLPLPSNYLASRANSFAEQTIQRETQALLRQIYGRHSGELRTWNCDLIALAYLTKLSLFHINTLMPNYHVHVS